MTLYKKWEELDSRLRKLDLADLEEENELISNAYDQLVLAYQEARQLNDEMEMLLREALH